MGKIHTHYDNLKVARLAPPEVIRAAYKALSQKYHPDKNPGDEKAARIMAILNSAYGTLADPLRRKEHDEWIAAEEWEIEWLESTHQEDNRGKQRGGPGHAWADAPAAAPVRRPYRIVRDWRWWGGLGACLGLGWLAGLLTASQPNSVPEAWTLVWRGFPELRHPASPVLTEQAVKASLKPKAEAASLPTSDAVVESWAGKPTFTEPAPKPQIKIVALSQVVLSAPAPLDCSIEAQTQALVAPNGEPWPLQSGYVSGFPIGNKGEDLQLTLDNAGNPDPVFIKLYDLDRRSNVRYIFILAHDKLTVDQLGVGRYEVRYQRIDISGKDGCLKK